MNLSEIKKIASNHKKTIKCLAQEIGMTEQHLHWCIRENKMQSSQLKKVAEIFKVPISVFLSDHADSGEKSTSKLKEPKVKYGICADCEQKDMIIKALTERTKKLEKRLAQYKRKK